MSVLRYDVGTTLRYDVGGQVLFFLLYTVMHFIDVLGLVLFLLDDVQVS